MCSGQQINYTKSTISFSSNVNTEEQIRLADLLGVQRTDQQGNYLGVPTQVGRSKEAAFSYIVERVRQKCENWKSKLLSSAGKEILIKSVLQSVPAYLMQCFLIPKSLCDDMQQYMARLWWGDKDGKQKMHWMSWSKLCRTKRAGGLGFKDMHHFNLALLANQGWRLIQKPEGVLARVLKAKYFPSCGFLEAKLHPGSSFTWRSLMAGRVVLEKGVRRQVGDGCSTRVWHDPWVPLPQRFKPFTLLAAGSEEMRVDQLLMQNEGWNVDLLRSLFTEYEAEIIANIPIGIRRREDKWVWHYDKRGVYSVKSGYWVWHCNTNEQAPSSSNSNQAERLWSKLWSSRIPGKVAIFIWQVITNSIPTKVNLVRRHIHVDVKCCAVCGDALETSEHVFVSCEFAKALWRYSGLKVQLGGNLNISDWMWLMVERLQGGQVELFLICVWSLWHNRNRALKEERFFDPGSLMTWCISYWTKYTEVQRPLSKASVRPQTKWLCPPTGRLKMNVDGSFDAGTRSGGIGVIVRNEVGWGIAAMGRTIKYACSAFAMEVEACRAGLLLGITQGWRDVDIESDSTQLVQALKREETDLSEVGQMVEDCKELIKEMQSVTVRHIYQEGNGAADRLARMANNWSMDRVWLDEMPVMISDILVEDSNDMPNVVQNYCNRFQFDALYSPVSSNNNGLVFDPH